MWTEYELYVDENLFFTTHRFDVAVEIATQAKREHPDLKVKLYKLTEEVVEFDE